MKTALNSAKTSAAPRRRFFARAAAAFALLAAAVAPALGGGAKPVTVEPGGALVIPTATVTGVAAFFPVKVNGTDMEVLAIRDSRGKIRTAFNTCQVCYDSGRGFFKQSGNNLVCQNCHNAFTADQVEVAAGGCNPWPIFAKDKTETDREIRISYEFLARSQRIFAKWKAKK